MTSIGDHVAHVPPVGSPPSAAVLLVCALLYATPVHASGVLANVTDDDMPTAALAVVLSAIRGLVHAGKPPGPELVLDAIQRHGTLKRFALKALHDAVTCGAVPGMAVHYAAAVVAISLRRRVESAGSAMVNAADESPESALAPMVERAAESIADCAHRLESLRGEN